ncbi:winged helix-turn-helix domain-containing protein [Clavibacter nebraskensis]|uniref:winged helix-turn-helix domain-containing protein n=1 Tax=Clavibacter nebraskensis TaxID=31963 RepID=UPI003F4C6541
MDPVRGSSGDGVRALGFSSMRARILQLALQEGPLTASALMAELGLSRAGVETHIKVLVAAGLLVAEQDPEVAGRAGGGGNRLRWRADPVAFDRAVDEYRRTVRGPL